MMGACSSSTGRTAVITYHIHRLRLMEWSDLFSSEKNKERLTSQCRSILTSLPAPWRTLELDSELTPFKCKLCPDGFGRKVALARHVKLRRASSCPSGMSFCMPGVGPGCQNGIEEHDQHKAYPVADSKMQFRRIWRLFVGQRGTSIMGMRWLERNKLWCCQCPGEAQRTRISVGTAWIATGLRRAAHYCMMYCTGTCSTYTQKKSSVDTSGE
ncbi:hypothetical protein BDZ89DRAFT_402312 [Hymenopellis radicata]|nr:hypothetical protein BDZ89DRAFT_402312 [Hymenopellis radicata]